MTRYNQVSQKVCILVLLFDRAIVWCMKLVIFHLVINQKLYYCFS